MGTNSTVDFSRNKARAFARMILFSLAILFQWSNAVLAQAISLIIDADANTQVASIFEDEVKNNLRAKGYNVLTDKNAGLFTIGISLLETIDRNANRLGYTASQFVVSIAINEYINSRAFEACANWTYNDVKEIKNLIGTEMIYIDSHMATNASLKDLAKSLSDAASNSIENVKKNVNNVLNEMKQKIPD